MLSCPLVTTSKSTKVGFNSKQELLWEYEREIKSNYIQIREYERQINLKGKLGKKKLSALKFLSDPN